ncbi:Lrp/AsnC family transcriptional regulator [Cognatazoarcus halotolerans]|uniref:Lrp/AsnC family transcriptional regulator n=1 Tax=Cognatazoarcus halotolerans TaxID=2686016 RepID=UPI00135AF19B|nr:Lrp/AsnC family transcriptional regulator [Cognatazoarcus halotolerans]MBX3680289.1 Lrp/AsnC family transcriptional regulator [Rhodocyclaceae bacterium]MCB1901611.1 Lrp/AsnC family transcriptional regulator [Rhodocyclaceae bacterium]MCP5308456.1 Lrp/AsnC family transcriptional regulator [Zoogloeaceae bacterium]
MLDRVSRRMLAELQRDSRLSVQELANQVGMSSTPCWRRLKEIEKAGLIRRYTVLLDREALGLKECLLAHVTLQRHAGQTVEEFERAVLAHPEVIECYSTTGDADYILKVVVPDMKAYDAFLQKRIFGIPGVASVRTAVVLREIKYDTVLPID